jgi:acyl-CoA dehydrogenase
MIPSHAKHRLGPADVLTQRCAEIITEPSDTRERLTSGLHLDAANGGAVLVERAFHLVHAAEPVRHRLRQAKIRDWHVAQAKGMLTAAEIAALEAAEAAVHQAIMVDDFSPEELKPRRGEQKEPKPSQPIRDNRQAVRSM